MEKTPINPDELAKKALDKTTGRLSRYWFMVTARLPILDTWPKRLLFWSVIISVIFSIVYTSAWYWTITSTRTKYIHWVNTFVREGYPFGEKGITLSGFPGRPTITIERPSFSGYIMDTSWASDAKTMVLDFDVWQPHRLRFRLTDFRLNSHIVDKEQRTGALFSPEITGMLVKDQNGWRITVETKKITGRGLGYLEPFELYQAYLSLDTSDPSQNSWAKIHALFKGQSIPVEPDKQPQTIELLARGHIRSEIYAGHFDRALKEWRDNHGSINLDEVYFRWGAVSVKSNEAGADISLNSRMQIQSIFQADVINFQHMSFLIDYLRKNRFMTDFEADVSLNHIRTSNKNVGNMQIFLLDSKVAFDSIVLFPSPSLARQPIVSTTIPQ